MPQVQFSLFYCVVFAGIHAIFDGVTSLPGKASKAVKQAMDDVKK